MITAKKLKEIAKSSRYFTKLTDKEIKQYVLDNKLLEKWDEIERETNSIASYMEWD